MCVLTCLRLCSLLLSISHFKGKGANNSYWPYRILTRANAEFCKMNAAKKHNQIVYTTALTEVCCIKLNNSFGWFLLFVYNSLHVAHCQIALSNLHQATTRFLKIYNNLNSKYPVTSAFRGWGASSILIVLECYFQKPDKERVFKMPREELFHGRGTITEKASSQGLDVVVSERRNPNRPSFYILIKQADSAQILLDKPIQPRAKLPRFWDM